MNRSVFMAKTGTLSGTIINKSGKPLGNVSVFINGTKKTASDLRGRYIIRDLKPGTYIVKFSKPGYSPIID